MPDSSSITTWGILGLGWLGSALSGELERRGHPVWGTHRVAFTFEKDPLPRTASDVLFLNSPPLSNMPAVQYVDKVAATAASRVIFISSTSVYGLNEGRVTEATVPLPETSSARWLLEVETLLRARLGARLTVIRPGGLIGDKRHPVYFLAKRGASIGDGRINFIHRDDLIRVVLAVAARDDVPLVNAVSPRHPLKSDYYAKWTTKLGLPSVHFDDKLPESNRVVDSDVLPALNIAWTHDQLDTL